MALYGNNDQSWGAGVELAAVMTGAVVFIGALAQTPNKLIFDNQGTVAVAISVNDPSGATVWRTFPGGEAMILDGDLGAFPKGTRFYGTGASGTFSISYTYVKQ